MARPTNAEIEARRAAAQAAADVGVIETVQVEAKAVVEPVTAKGIDLAAVAKSLNAGFTPHEHGGVFHKGTKHISLNVANYTDENHVKLALRHNGITG